MVCDINEKSVCNHEMKVNNAKCTLEGCVRIKKGMFFNIPWHQYMKCTDKEINMIRTSINVLFLPKQSMFAHSERNFVTL